MRTSKPISTISYNTEPYLRTRLDELIQAKKISDYMYIIHLPEEDEKKKHIHVWLKPNTLLDTMDLQKHFLELDIQNPQKPFRCLDFRPSQVDDWILYNQHYRPYLLAKGEDRKLYYEKKDFKYYDENQFEDTYLHAFKSSDWATQTYLMQLVADPTVDPFELATSGIVPFGKVQQLNALLNIKKFHSHHTYRGGRPNHEEE